MAQDLQGLLDKIKQDGTQQAEADKKIIIAEAEKKAASLIADAKNEAEKIVKNAKDEADSLIKRSESAIRQSSRDIILTLKNELEDRLNHVIQSNTNMALTPQFMAEIIAKMCDQFITNPNEKITILTSANYLDSLSQTLKTSLVGDLKNQPELFVDKELKNGFKINFSSDNVFYDFSNEAIQELISAYVSPVIADLLNK